MLAVISNQHLTKNNIRRKAGKCKTAHSSPPDYETRNIVSTSDGVSCAENDEKNRIQKRIRSWISQRGERLSKTIQQDSGLYLQYVSGGQIDGCKEKQKMIEKIISGRPDRPMILNKPIDGSLKVGDIVFTKSHVVLDVGFVKSTFPLRIYSRSTKYDFGGVPGEVELTFGRVNYYKLYYSGVNMSLDKWKEISLDASAEEVCKKIGISYRRE